VGALALLRGVAAEPRGDGARLRGEVVALGRVADEPCGAATVPRGTVALGRPVEAGGETGGVARREMLPLAGVPVLEPLLPGVVAGVSGSPGVRAATDRVLPSAAPEDELPPRVSTPERTGSVLACPRPSSVRKLTSSPSAFGGAGEAAFRTAT